MGERALVEKEVAVISRTSAIPIHTQFRAHLLRRIESGELRQGQKLPSERQDAYLSPQAFPNILHADLTNGSLYRTMEALYGVVPTRAVSTIEVIRSQGEAELLGLTPGTPALQVEGTTFDAADRPVEFSRVIYRADRFRFTIESFHRQDRVFHLIGAG